MSLLTVGLLLIILAVKIIIFPAAPPPIKIDAGVSVFDPSPPDTQKADLTGKYTKEEVLFIDKIKTEPHDTPKPFGAKIFQ